MSDPMSLLLEAIEAREKRANDCLTDGSRWWDWQQLRAKGSWFTAADAKHIALHDPSSVIRHCKADRELVELHGIVWRDIGWLEWDEGEHAEMYEEIPVCGLCVPKHSSFPRREDVPEGPCRTVRILAEAYGITEEER